MAKGPILEGISLQCNRDSAGNFICRTLSANKLREKLGLLPTGNDGGRP
jgi:hypothetical protein